MNIKQARLHIAETTDDLCQQAVAYWIECAQAAIKDHGHFYVALSGGTTPKMVFKLLSERVKDELVDWSRVHIYFGDERCVPADHEDSNFRMAREALLNHVSLPLAHIHRVPTELGHTEGANQYARILEETVPDKRFDLIMLGLGPDGHIASLFPDTPILDAQVTPVNDVCVVKMA